MNTAIVLGCHISGLAIIRSLGQRGVPVIAVDYDKQAIGLASKYVSEAVIAPHPKRSGSDFLAFLQGKSDRWKNGVLIPTEDSTTCLLSKNRLELSKYYIVSVPGWNLMENIMDKRLTYKIAGEAGIPVPFSVDASEWHKYEDRITYPCILKPVFGQAFPTGLDQKVCMINDARCLQSKLEQGHASDIKLIVQEIIPGADDQYYFYAAYYGQNGKPLAEFTGRKLRQFPPGFGLGRVFESTKTPGMIEMGRRLMQALSYTGLCEIEFKRDKRDNTFKLIEINGRTWMQMELCTRSGMDFPWIMYRDLTKQGRCEVNGYDAGMKWIHVYNDIMAILRYRDKEGWSLKDYIMPYLGKKVFAVYTCGDLWPFIKDCRQNLAKILRSKMSRLMSRDA